MLKTSDDLVGNGSKKIIKRKPEDSKAWNIYCVPKKTRDHVFDDKLNLNCLFTKIFGILKRTIGHRQVFLFSHLTYLVQLLYLGKLSRRRYQQKLNIIMKISQEDVILIKNLYLSKQYGARRVLSENCLTRVGNLEASTVCWREATRRVQLSRNQAAVDRVCRIAMKDLVLSSVRTTSQKGIGQLIRFPMKLPFSVQVYTEK